MQREYAELASTYEDTEAELRATLTQLVRVWS